MLTNPPPGDARPGFAHGAAEFLDPRPRLRRLLQRLGRARDHSGHERQTLLLVAKSAVAAVASWALAVYAAGSTQPAYAPFTALLVVQSTVYRSLLQSTQYVGAVMFGVAATWAAEVLLGRSVGAFALVIVFGLLIGRWHRLGSMGLQVPVAGIFAYTALSAAQPTALWSIVSMVLLGAGTGLVVNVALLPPMRYGTGAQGLHELTTAVHTLLCDIAGGLREGRPQTKTVRDWARRARNMDSTAARARHAVEHAAESVSYNPRRLVSRRVPRHFTGYRTMVESMQRAGEQTRSIVTGLHYALDGESGYHLRTAFLRSYSDVLASVAEAARWAGSTEQTAEADLQQALREGNDLYDELVRDTDPDDVWPAMGALMADAARLMEEFDRAHRRGAVRPW